ncbi:sterol delta 5-6-desaturase ERG3 [Apiospora arundinis]|uniref:Sterol delta 5-6-desaturase ERG3 n=1 Tax=Apiospora arundinis TaxID=335852 RepID=A0ABR2J9Z8_9PEZI
MDIVNELFDTFVGDYVWAQLLPARLAPYEFPSATNASVQSFSPWQYKPATKFFSIEPSPAAYESMWPRDHICRQGINLFLITYVFGLLTYYGFSTLSYIFVFDKETMKHPKYLKNQIRLEMRQATSGMFGMALLTSPLFLAEVRGHSKLYDLTEEGPGLWYNVVQLPFFLLFTDFFIYWIHRGLHHKLVYKTLHKPHHRWIMPTPYASHAFHPLDGFAQSIPYHVFPFLFPLQKLSYVALFVFVNIWTILIHDGEYVANSPVINGAACHTMHHLYFNYNYGQYTTLWDRLGGSYRKPNPELFRKDQKMSDREWNKQVQEMEQMVVEVEGRDDRTYEPVDAKKND